MLRNKSRVVKTGEKPTIIAFYFLNITQDEMRIIFCDFGLYCVEFYVLFGGLILERRACVTANKWPVLNSSTVDNTYAIILSCVLWYTLSAYIKVDGSMPFPRLMPAWHFVARLKRNAYAYIFGGLLSLTYRVLYKLHIAVLRYRNWYLKLLYAMACFFGTVVRTCQQY